MSEFQYLDGGNSEAQDRLATSYLFAQDSAGLATDGVLSGLAVAQTTTASASVTIAAGACAVQDSVLSGVALLVNDSQKTLDVLGANPMGGTPRNDIVVFDAATVSGGTGGVRLIVGTPNAVPTDPTVPTTAVPLARIRNAASATTVPSSAIDDLRTYTTLGFTPTLNRCQITSTADQTLTDAVATVVTMGATSYDVGGMADLGNNRIKITKAGWYQFSVRAMFAFNAAGLRGLIVEKNGTTIVADLYASPTSAGTGSIGTVVSFTTEPISCAVNDTFRVKALQTAGGTLPLIAINGRRVIFTATQQVGN